MEKNYCKQCKHYRQHYAFDRERIIRIYCGHCTNRTARRRRPDTAACDEFTPGVPDEDIFASKAYLSKALLQHVLNMDLLPTIEDATNPKIR